jgi:ABC-type multidrug transport system ATPase subunit
MKLELTGLGKYFGTRWVFRELDLAPTGGIIGISGENGSGKSTLLRCLAGLIRPDRGAYMWYDALGEPITFDMRSQGGYAAPYIHLYKDLTCRETLDFLQAPLGKHFSEQYIPLFESLGISDKLDALYGSLSSGQQQRVKLISAVIHSPKVLFLDEPGTNLDQRGLAFIQGVVNERRVRKELTILATNQSDELSWCDQVVSVNPVRW